MTNGSWAVQWAKSTNMCDYCTVRRRVHNLCTWRMVGSHWKYDETEGLLLLLTTGNGRSSPLFIGQKLIVESFLSSRGFDFRGGIVILKNMLNAAAFD